jgi:hypothetical protein
MASARFTRRFSDMAGQLNFDRKLASYLTASASVAAVASSEAKAVIVSTSRVQPFGINGEVNIDFNSDSQTDFQIDHDRINVNGVDLDFLQLDKNDASSPANPYAINPIATFPLNGTQANGDHAYMAGGEGDIGFYPNALLAGTEIGPLQHNFDFQEGDNFQSQNKIIHANRLIDEDMTQVDAANPNPPANKTPIVPGGTPGWIGLNGQTRYLGVRIDLNDAGEFGLNDPPTNYWYGWIGVRITNEADATGEVVGYGYETQINTAILAGGVSPEVSGDYSGNGVVDATDYVIWRQNLGLMSGATVSQGDGNGDGMVTNDDYNIWRGHYGAPPGAGAGLTAVPEPATLLTGIFAGLMLLGTLLFHRIRRV